MAGVKRETLDMTREKTMVSALNEVKMDVSTLFPRLHETLKTKSSEKLAVKMCNTIEEIKENQLEDMKTFSGMNTMLQGIKASDNKIATQIKDLQSIFKDKNQVGLGNKDQANMTKGFKDLEIKHDLALENMKVYQLYGPFLELLQQSSKSQSLNYVFECHLQALT